MAKSKRASFVAIGVGQGDAFFIEKNNLTGLVDGGKAIKGFPEHFQSVTSRNSVNVLVCTHNDADHANGVLGFLRVNSRVTRCGYQARGRIALRISL